MIFDSLKVWNIYLTGLIFVIILNTITLIASQACNDENGFCDEWANSGLCHNNEYVQTFCRRACRQCNVIPVERFPRKYSVQALPRELITLSFLLGIWREEFDGKARFPTMPTFSYGEQLDFSLADESPGGRPTLNYTAHAWGHNTREELHSESGYITSDGRRVALTTVMSNGFTTIEEGPTAGDNSMILRLKDISRISFSRDLPVNGMRREWYLVGPNTLEQVVSMSTITHQLQEHTRIRYHKIYP